LAAGKKFFTLRTLLTITISVILLWAAIYIGKYNAKIKLYTKTEATLFDSRPIKTHTYGYERVTGYTAYYKYEAGEKTYTLRDKRNKAPKTETKRMITYNPDNPREAFFVGLDPNWLLLLFGLAWTIISVFSFFEKPKPYLC